MECLQTCLSDARCISNNFFKALYDQKNVCEMNKGASSNDCDSTKHLISAQGWVYSQVKVKPRAELGEGLGYTSRSEASKSSLAIISYDTKYRGLKR